MSLDPGLVATYTEVATLIPREAVGGAWVERQGEPEKFPVLGLSKT